MLVENFLPGTMESAGASRTTSLRAATRGCVYATISGFGADGPLGGLPGYDAVLQAMCGLMSVCSCWLFPLPSRLRHSSSSTASISSF